MNTEAEARLAEGQPLHSQARPAGLLYAASGIGIPFAPVVLTSRVFVLDDASATADRNRAARGLVHIAIAGEPFTCALIVIALLALFRLFRQVSESLAAAMLILFLVSAERERTAGFESRESIIPKNLGL
ncbi:MAG TPA: DUF4386 family protein [Gemmatimonadaceae bacterium]|nr:DUF4386 family protein [Gemmatimonadaceae bacterium]